MDFLAHMCTSSKGLEGQHIGRCNLQNKKSCLKEIKHNVVEYNQDLLGVYLYHMLRTGLVDISLINL